MERLHNRRQNEATEYGSAFARAMEVVLGDARYVFVSGTASIDDHGTTVHVGDFETQTRYTLEAVEALLEGAGAGLRDVAQATAFLKNPCDGRAFERVVERSSLDGAPLVTTVADVCRDDLLFEIDAVAVVPLRPRGAAVTAVRPRSGPRDPARGRRASGRAGRADGGGPGAARATAGAQVPSRARRAALPGNAGPLGEGGRLVLVPPGGRPRVLTASFHSAADPEVSFDGKSILFAGKKTADGPVVRLRDEGGRQRAATGHLRRGRRSPARLPVHGLHDHADERRALGAGRVRRREPGRAERGRGRAEHEPVVVQDGRHGAAPADLQPVERPGPRRSCPTAAWSTPGGCARRGESRVDRVALLGVNEDGTDYQTYAGDQGLRVKQTPAPTANGLVVFVEADRIEGDGSGTARVGEPGAPAAQLPLADRREGRPVPRAVPVARRAPARGLAPCLRDRGRGQPLPSPSTRLDPSTGAHEKVFGEAGWDVREREARGAPARARRALERRSRRRPAGEALHDRRRDPGAGPGAAEGGGEEPARRRGRGRDGSQPARVRRLLGEVEVADDGSYQVQIPANTPVQLRAPRRATARRCAPRRGCGCATTPRRAASAATRTRSARRRTG